MEFNSMVNKLLRRDPTTRRRQLAIRTYAVIPLSENNGIVEWVSTGQTCEGPQDSFSQLFGRY